MVEPLGFHESRRRLDAIFEECIERETTPFDDRLHLRVVGSNSREELEGALLALVSEERLYLIDDYRVKQGLHDVADVSIYDPA